jgi:hypothetical protein
MVSEYYCEESPTFAPATTKTHNNTNFEIRYNLKTLILFGDEYLWIKHQNDNSTRIVDKISFFHSGRRTVDLFIFFFLPPIVFSL